MVGHADLGGGPQSVEERRHLGDRVLELFDPRAVHFFRGSVQGRGSCLRGVAFGFVGPLPHGKQPPRELPLEVNVEHLAREVPP